MNKYSIDELKKLIFDDKLSYEEIGKRYNVTGGAIRLFCKRNGVNLPQKRKVSNSENFNKGKSKYNKSICPICQKEFIIYPNKSDKFCSNKCQSEYEYQEYIKKWKKGEVSGHGERYKISSFVRRFLLERCNYSCEECGCNKVNSFTNKTILQIHHIDGDASNSSESNLKVLCPNCHSMTENFGSRNKNSVRDYRKTEYNAHMV